MGTSDAAAAAQIPVLYSDSRGVEISLAQWRVSTVAARGRVRPGTSRKRNQSFVNLSSITIMREAV